VQNASVPVVSSRAIERVALMVELPDPPLSKQMLSPVAGWVPLLAPPELFDQLPLTFQLPDAPA
jgi:hypothetical protein